MRERTSSVNTLGPTTYATSLNIITKVLDFVQFGGVVRDWNSGCRGRPQCKGWRH